MGGIYDKSSIPEIVIKTGQIGSIKITKSNDWFYLHENDLLWMDYNPKTKRQIRETFSCYDLAYGDVLITGFGFGVLLCWLANKPKITSITVIEKSKEVVDLFLRDNELPTNLPITILYEDANIYTDDKKYDCLLIDHLDHEEDMVATARSIGLNIKHDVMWFWPLELIYVRQAFGINDLPLYFVYTKKENRVDFATKWEEFRSSLNIPTVPNLTLQQMKYYVNVYGNNFRTEG